MFPHPLLALLFLELGTILVLRKPSPLAFLLAAACAGAALFSLVDRPRRRIRPLFLLFAAVAIAASIARVGYRPNPPLTRLRAGTPVDLLARVVKPPAVSPRRVILTLDTLGAYEQSAFFPLSGGARLSLYAPETRLRYGDTVLVRRVKVHPPRPYENPGAFDLTSYLEARGIYLTGGVSRDDRITILQRGGGSPFWRTIYRQREKMLSFVNGHPQGNDRALLKAMVLGVTGELTPQLRDRFAAAGTAHLLAISGLNAGFVAFLFYQLLRLLLRVIALPPYGLRRPRIRPSKAAALLTTIPVLYYFAVADWSASIFRATLMVLFYLIFKALDRDRSLHEILALAALIILFWRPASLFDIGFQLSFLSVLAIISSLPSRSGAGAADGAAACSRGQLLDRAGRWVRASLWATLWTTLGTLPLVLYYFNRLSLVGLPANLITVPLASLIVPVGFLSLLFSLFSPGLAGLPFSAALLLCRLLLSATAFFARLPAASLRLPTPPAAAILLYYLALLLWWVLRGRRLRVAAALVPAALALLVAARPVLFPPRDGKLTVSFIDVGHGESALLRFPDGRRLLLDGGGSYDPAFDFGERVVGPFLWRHQITSLDAVAVTHAQFDHAGGIPAILRNFPVRDFWTGTADPRYAAMTLASGGRSRWRVSHPGQILLQGDNFTVQALWPPSWGFLPKGHRVLSENNNSLVLKVRFGKVSLLFTGDLEAAGERALLRRYGAPGLRSTVLKVDHHGSKTGSLPEFLAAVHPEVAVISVGAFNPFGHPAPSVLQRLRAVGARIYRTDRHGAITFQTDGETWEVTTFLSPGKRPQPAPAVE